MYEIKTVPELLPGETIVSGSGRLAEVVSVGMVEGDSIDITLRWDLGHGDSEQHTVEYQSDFEVTFLPADYEVEHCRATWDDKIVTDVVAGDVVMLEMGTGSERWNKVSVTYTQNGERVLIFDNAQKRHCFLDDKVKIMHKPVVKYMNARWA